MKLLAKEVISSRKTTGRLYQNKAGGSAQAECSYTHSLKAPGFNPCT
jgi:hypothetical protein